MMEDPSQIAPMLQRLFTRLDHIEFSLVRQNAQDMMQLRDTVGQMQRSRRQQDVNPMTASFGHRGPGALPVPAAPPGIGVLGRDAQLTSTPSIHEANAIEQSLHGDVQELSTGPRRVFTNSLVKSRESSPLSGPEEFTIASPAPGTRPWPQSPEAPATEPQAQAPAGAELPVPSTAQALDLPAPAGALHIGAKHDRWLTRSSQHGL